MNIAATVKKAPRWAWYTAGGLGLGAAAIKLYQHRGGGTATDTTNTPAADIGTTVGTTGGTPPGVIVPPVILGGNAADPNVGVGPLQDLYVGAAGSLFSAWENLLGPVMGTQNQLLLGNADTISQIAMAGGPPQSAPTPVISFLPIPQHIPVALTPKPAAGPGYKTEFRNATKDNGKAGKQRVAWCVKQEVHRYPDGHGVVVNETKIHDGAC